MILTGWKEIARYLGCGVRTVQRWERNKGLPLKRPTRGGAKRGHVIAHSEQLDSWIRNGVFRRSGAETLLANLERARELRIEVQRARANLHTCNFFRLSLSSRDTSNRQSVRTASTASLKFPK